MDNALTEKAKKINAVIFDVDGVLTDGGIIYTASGDECKQFHTRDGVGIKMLQFIGIEVCIITARNSPIVARRANELKITHFYQGQAHKLNAYNQIKTDINLQDDEIAYMGDDLIDIPVLKQAGLGITVPEACQPVVDASDWQTTSKGGYGAAREACEFIINAKNQWDAACQRYLQN